MVCPKYKLGCEEMTSLKEYSLFDDFDIMGRWYLIDQSLHEAIDGILHYSTNGVELELFGTFDSDATAIYETIDYLYGVSQKGKLLILQNCHMLKRKFNAPGFPISNYLVNEFFVFEFDEELFETMKTAISPLAFDHYTIEQLNFSTNYLDDFIDRSSLVKKWSTDKKWSSIESDMQDYKIDEYKIGDNQFKIKSDISVSRTPNSYFEKQALVIQSNNSENDFSSFMEQAKLIKNLLGFLTNIPVHFEYIQLSLKKKDIENSKKVTGRYFFNQVGEKIEGSKRLPVAYSDIQEEFGSILKYWYEKNDKLDFIISGYFSDLYLPYFLHIKLLNSIRNLEIYHRNFIDPGEEIDEELEKEQEKVIEYIKNNISKEEYQNRFEKNIRYYSEMHLHKRLKELFKILPEEIADKLIKHPNKSPSNSIDRLAYKLKETRNYYTHGDDEERYPNKIHGKSEIFFINEVLRIIIRYFIYYELGISKEKILEILKDETNSLDRNYL